MSMSQSRDGIDYLCDLIPTTWLDPLLSGPNAVLKGNGPWTGTDIENLLRALKERVWEAEQPMRIARSESRQSDGWVSVKDSLPKPEVIDGETAPCVPVLFYISTADEGRAVCAGRYYPNERRAAWKSLQGAPYRRDEVTHWMPMPDKPIERDGK